MKKFRLQKPRHLWAVALLIVSLVCIAVGGNPPVMVLVKGTFLGAWLYAHVGAPAVLSVGTGLFSGLAIWLFAVYFPERKKQQILRINMDRCYWRFRRGVLEILRLPMQGSAPSVDELLDHKTFRAYFGDEEGGKRWDFIFNWLGKNPYYVHEILYEMDILCREATHVRNNCIVQNPKVHNFFGGMTTMMMQFQGQHLDYDRYDLKPFMRYLFSIFAQWNMFDGELENDPIQSIIDEI